MSGGVRLDHARVFLKIQPCIGRASLEKFRVVHSRCSSVSKVGPSNLKERQAQWIICAKHGLSEAGDL